MTVRLHGILSSSFPGTLPAPVMCLTSNVTTAPQLSHPGYAQNTSQDYFQ